MTNDEKLTRLIDIFEMNQLDSDPNHQRFGISCIIINSYIHLKEFKYMYQNEDSFISNTNKGMDLVFVAKKLRYIIPDTDIDTFLNALIKPKYHTFIEKFIKSAIELDQDVFHYN